MSRKWIGLASAAVMLASPAVAADTVKIGYVTTLSGPASIIGKHMKDAFELGVAHLDGKVGGLETEVFWGDDQQKPDVGKQEVNSLLKRDRVQFVAGIIWSNVLMAVYDSVVRSDTFLISSNAGPSPIAGEKCNENFFSVSWQNDQTPEAMGKYLQDKGISDVYLIAPNYQAGKDMLAGVQRYYKGSVVAQVFTALGQSDYQAELSALRAAKPKAVFVFLPGGMGINFIKQYDQAGLRTEIPLYTAFTADAVSLPAVKEAALGVLGTQTWSPDLDNEVNKKFVSDFRAKYGYMPSFYAAQAYDTAMFLDAAIRKVGNVTDRDALRAAMRSGDFPNTRGKIKFNNNHFPIQDFYLREVVKEADGTFTTKIVDTVFKDHGDSYAKDCPMKW
jgi:branched-chain amino acid transport system substrate-binding protein